MKRKENIRSSLFYGGILFLLIAIGDLWGLIDFHQILGKGELYDIAFVFFVFGWFTWCFLDKEHINNIKKFPIQELVPIIILVMYCTIEGLIIILKHEQGILQTTMVVRELWYVIILFPFFYLKYNIKTLIRLITIFDIVGCIIYILEMFTGPLTLLHVTGRMNIGLYRFYSDNPLFPYFLCPLIIYGLAKNIHIFTKKIDAIIFVLFVVTMLLRLSKMAFAALLLVCIISYVTCKGTDTNTLVKRIMIVVLIMLGAIILGGVCVPQVVNYFYEGLIGLVHIFDPAIHSNLTYRAETMQERWIFLKENRKLLWGMGPLHNDSTVFIGSIENPANTGVIASDIAYGTILVRYGVVGVVGGIIFLLQFSYRMFKKNDIGAKSLALYCCAILIAAICGHTALCFQAFLKLGMLIGIVLKELSVRQPDS